MDDCRDDWIGGWAVPPNLIVICLFVFSHSKSCCFGEDKSHTSGQPCRCGEENVIDTILARRETNNAATVAGPHGQDTIGKRCTLNVRDSALTARAGLASIATSSGS